MRGWSEHATQDGRKYFFHKRRKISQYGKPGLLKSLDEKLAEAYTQYAIYYMYLDGKTIFYNKSTKVSSFTVPEEIRVIRNILSDRGLGKDDV